MYTDIYVFPHQTIFYSQFADEIFYRKIRNLCTWKGNYIQMSMFLYIFEHFVKLHATKGETSETRRERERERTKRVINLIILYNY